MFHGALSERLEPFLPNKGNGIFAPILTSATAEFFLNPHNSQETMTCSIDKDII
jgi:hypothetical protein